MSTVIYQVESIIIQEIIKSLFSSLKVAESVWKEGLLLKGFPEESLTMRTIEDCWDFLQTEGGQQR